jgi:hypothetical protein
VRQVHRVEDLREPREAREIGAAGVPEEEHARASSTRPRACHGPSRPRPPRADDSSQHFARRAVRQIAVPHRGLGREGPPRARRRTNARPGAVLPQGRRNADAAHFRACRRRARKSIVRGGGVAARRRHAKCEAAKVLCCVSVRSAPMIGTSPTPARGEGPPVRAPPAGGAAWSGAGPA